MNKKLVENIENDLRKSRLSKFDLDKRRCWNLWIIDVENGYILHNQSLRELRWDICKEDKLVDYTREETCIAINWNHVTNFEIYTGCSSNSWCQKDK